MTLALLIPRPPAAARVVKGPKPGRDRRYEALMMQSFVDMRARAARRAHA